MVVLLTGATGFIGARLARALLDEGHQLVCAVRRRPVTDPHPDGRVRYVSADFTRDIDAAVWIPRLEGVDAVINAVGILRERGAQRFASLHDRAPKALFAACESAGVRRVIQISALGADERAISAYHRSKKAADDFLTSLPLAWSIVQPSVVYGEGGTSARLFSMLASLPIVPLPGGGKQLLQPVHIDDLIEAIVKLLAADIGHRTRIPIVGPEPLSLREFLARLRTAMGESRAIGIPVPISLVRLSARVAGFIPGSLLDAQTLQMLEQGNIADSTAARLVLGRPPRGVESVVPPRDVEAVRTHAKLQWLPPILRWSVALVWIFTGIVSLGIYPVSESYELLARVGTPPSLAPVLLYGAALLDLAFGIAILTLRRRRLLWTVQMAVILAYTLIISLRLPEFWLHPYGPVLKNLPLLAAIWLLREMEPSPHSGSAAHPAAAHPAPQAQERR